MRPRIRYRSNYTESGARTSLESINKWARERETVREDRSNWAKYWGAWRFPLGAETTWGPDETERAPVLRTAGSQWKVHNQRRNMRWSVPPPLLSLPSHLKLLPAEGGARAELISPSMLDQREWSTWLLIELPTRHLTLYNNNSQKTIYKPLLMEFQYAFTSSVFSRKCIWYFIYQASVPVSAQQVITQLHLI